MVHLTELLARVVVVTLCYFDVWMVSPADATRNHTEPWCPRACETKVLSVWLIRPLLLAGVTGTGLDRDVVRRSDAMAGLCRSSSTLTLWCVNGAVLIAVARVVHRPCRVCALQDAS